MVNRFVSIAPVSLLCYSVVRSVDFIDFFEDRLREEVPQEFNYIRGLVANNVNGREMNNRKSHRLFSLGPRVILGRFLSNACVTWRCPVRLCDLYKQNICY